jgi:predicted nucleotidyltransferase
MSLKDAIVARYELFAEIGAEYGLRCIMLHGSVAAGRESAQSDVDIALLPGSRGITYEDEAAIAHTLAALVGTYELDVHTVDTYKSSALLFHEAMQGIVLYEDEPGRADALRTYAWKLCIEARPLRTQRFARARAWLAQVTAV